MVPELKARQLRQWHDTETVQASGRQANYADVAVLLFKCDNWALHSMFLAIYSHQLIQNKLRCLVWHHIAQTEHKCQLSHPKNPSEWSSTHRKAWRDFWMNWELALGSSSSIALREVVWSRINLADSTSHALSQTRMRIQSTTKMGTPMRKTHPVSECHTAGLHCVWYLT